MHRLSKSFFITGLCWMLPTMLWGQNGNSKWTFHGINVFMAFASTHHIRGSLTTADYIRMAPPTIENAVRYKAYAQGKLRGETIPFTSATVPFGELKISGTFSKKHRRTTEELRIGTGIKRFFLPGIALNWGVYEPFLSNTNGSFQFIAFGQILTIDYLLNHNLSHRWAVYGGMGLLAGASYINKLDRMGPWGYEEITPTPRQSSSTERVSGISLWQGAFIGGVKYNLDCQFNLFGELQQAWSTSYFATERFYDRHFQLGFGVRYKLVPDPIIDLPKEQLRWMW